MAFKKITDQLYRAYIHIAYKEDKEKVYSYAKKIGCTHSESELHDFYENSSGFAIMCNPQNFLIVLCGNCGDKKEKWTRLSVLVHECFHAAAQVLREKGMTLTVESEEAYAYYLEWMFGEAFSFYANANHKKKRKNARKS